MRADELWANYALKSRFTRPDMMAFFPGTVLSQLHGLTGDVREAMSLLAVVTQVLVTVAVLAGLMILARIFARGLALLRALGAPVRYVFAVVWSYSAVLILAGALSGLAVGIVAAKVLSSMVTARTDVLVTASISWPELHLVAGFFSLTLLLALLPAWAAIRRPVVPACESERSPMRRALVAVLLSALSAAPAFAEDTAHLAEAEGLRVLHAWTRATDTGEAFVFAEIENRGDTERLLTGAEAEGASTGQVVGFVLKDGQGSWTVLPSIPVAAGGDLDLEPDVLALRLDGVAAPLVEGGHLDVTFVFDTLRIPAEAEVMGKDARAHSHAGHSH